MFLDKFVLPSESEDEGLMIEEIMKRNGGRMGYIDNIYPCGIFSENMLRQLDFEAVTIAYGGNGCGKSTLLNLIAEKINLKRLAPRNSGEVFDLYVENCEYELGFDEENDRYRIPNGSRIITSDDVFDYMLAVRTNNQEITESKAFAKDEWAELKFGNTIKMRGMDDFEALRMQVLSRSKSVSRRKFVKKTAGQEAVLRSNGETALEYFETRLKKETLYCLDEPENSLAPRLQIQLVELINYMAGHCGCQFIIATHSPFILAMNGAKIYDLDDSPVSVKKWWQLDNTREYFKLFYDNRDLFMNGI